MNEQQMQPDGDAKGARGPAHSSGAYSRRTVLRGALGVAGGAAGGAALAAGTELVGAGAAQATPTASPAGEECRLPAPSPGVPDAYVCPPPPFQSVAATPGRGGTVRVFKASGQPPAPPREENTYWQELERRLGVRLEFNQAPISEYQRAAAVLIAGGDLPEITVLWPALAPEQYETIQQGAFTDLTDYLTGDALQQFPNLARFPEYAWRNVAVNDRIYGVPRMSVPGGVALLHRRDWAERVGVAEPANADDMFRMLTGFVTGDPNGNGQADTYGLAAHPPDNLLALSLATGMYRVPNGWRLNDDGTLTSAIETEEYRAALDFARRLWEADAYHPDSPTMTVAQARDALVGGQVGGLTAPVIHLAADIRLRANARRFDPEADLRALVPPGHDGGRG
jgi:putative aldouronate transport system substrate-binding protein